MPDAQVNTGPRKRSAPVTTAENSFEGTGLLLQKSDMVSFVPELLVPVPRCVD